MEIIYLDQNKWIELAKVRAGVLAGREWVELYDKLVAGVESGAMLFPLSASHVLETSKRNDLQSRGHLAETQAALSRGFAYRSRAGRLEVEVRAVLRRMFGLEEQELPPHWAVATSFVESFEPLDTTISSAPDALRVRRLNTHFTPAEQYVAFMKGQDEGRRKQVHQTIRSATAKIISDMEGRRALLEGESVDVRRRAYSALLFISHQDLFLRILGGLGFSFRQLQELGAPAIRALVDDVPTLNVEVEMVTRLESECGRLCPNDLFDIQSFYTAIPYSNRVIAEKASISRARQARLDSRYGVRLSHSLRDFF